MNQHPTTQYATDVCFGKIVTCKWEKLSCKRHLDDLERSKNDPTFEYVFDETRANLIIDFFEKFCHHVRGVFVGELIKLEMFQKYDLGCMFGWVDKHTGKRRFKTGYIRMARGQAKSTEMSGVVNFGMTFDAIYPPGRLDLRKFEGKPEVVCLAVDSGQADIVWGDARDMALASPKIAKQLKIQKHAISNKTRGGKLRKLSKDTKNKDGGAPCIIIVDEYHDHPTSSIKDKTAFGKGKRAQSLEIIITTAGEDAENKPCKIEDNMVKKILSGEFSAESYFGVIRELDENDDPHDKKNWVKSCPMFQSPNEYSKTIYEEMENEHDLAYGSGDNSKIRQWLIKRADLWQTDSEQKYFSGLMEKWKSLAVSKQKFIELTYGKDCFVGNDMSKRIDLTANGHVFPLDDDVYAICAHGLIPENTATKHEKGDRVPYRDWAKEGWCTLTDGDVNDDNAVIDNIHDGELNNKWNIHEFCHDPYNTRQLAIALENEGYVCTEVRQGVVTLSEPTKKFREKVIQGKIIHDGSPLLTWCISNALEITDNNGNIKLSKKHKDDSQRIDLIAAVLNAMSRAIHYEKSVAPSAIFF